jgi:hypothetical protein
MSDENGHNSTPPPPAEIQVPGWVTLGLPPNWNPAARVSFAWQKVPGVFYGQNQPCYALIFDSEVGRLGYPFGGEGVDNLLRQGHQIRSGLILP